MAVRTIAQFLDPQTILGQLNLTEGMHVADFGCGNLGYFILPAAHLIGKEGKAYAVDVQKAVLQGVRSKAKLEGLINLETVWANLEKAGSVNIPANSLQIGFLVNILFQNKDYKAILQETTRLLAPGGKLLVIDWKKIAIPFGPPVERRIEPDLIKQLASQLGLQFSGEIEAGKYLWGLLFVKK